MDKPLAVDFSYGDLEAYFGEGCSLPGTADDSRILAARLKQQAKAARQLSKSPHS